MPTPVTVTINVDASGAVAGAAQAKAALGQLFNQYGQLIPTTQAATNATDIATKSLARFANAPARGIGVLDALNASIFQATGGFQSMGAASVAAATGFRGLLFAGSNLIGTTGTIAAGLAALGVVLAVTSDNTKQFKEELRDAEDALLAMAKTLNSLALTAQSLLRDRFKGLQEEIDKTRIKMAEYVKTLREAEAGNMPFLASTKEIEENLKREQIRLIELEVALARYKGFLTEAIAVDAAHSSSAKDHARSLELLQFSINVVTRQSKDYISTLNEETALTLQNINLQIQNSQLRIRSATTIEKVNTALSQEITLLRKQFEEQSKGILNDMERANLRLEFENKILTAQIRAANEVKQINEEAKRSTEELRRKYDSIADSIAAAFFSSHQSIAESFRNLLAQMAQEWLASGLKDLFVSIAGGGKKSSESDINIAGFGIDVPLLRPSTSGGSSVSAPILALPSAGGGGTTINISVQALDTATLTAAVQSRIIPMIENAAAGRRTRIALA